MTEQRDILAVAEEVQVILRRFHVDAVVIGAVALAAHRYVRYTEDLDLGVTADLPTLRAVADALRQEGYSAELREPDAHDPLGGVLDMHGLYGSIQIISFAGRFPAVIKDALTEATVVTREGSTLHIAPIPQLVALKLYAGGLKAKADIVELLKRNPEADLRKIQVTCDHYHLHGLDKILKEINR